MLPVLPKINLTSSYNARPHAPHKGDPRPTIVPYSARGSGKLKKKNRMRARASPLTARSHKEHSKAEKEELMYKNNVVLLNAHHNVNAQNPRDIRMPARMMDWMSGVEGEQHRFMEAYADCKRQLIAVDSYSRTAPAAERHIAKGHPNQLETAVVSDLLLKLTNSVTRFRSLFRPVVQEMLQSVYKGYHLNDLAAHRDGVPTGRITNRVMPYFAVAASLDRRYDELQKQLRVWTDNQRSMESAELVRMLVVNRIAANYQVAIQHHAFLRWKYCVQRRRNQRRGLDNILNRLVEPSGIVYKRQLMQIWQLNALQNKHRRLTSQTRKAGHEQKRLRLKLRELKDSLETTVSESSELLVLIEAAQKDHRDMKERVAVTQASISNFIDSPEIPKTNVIVKLWIQTLNALEAQVQLAHLLNLQDPTRLFRISGTETPHAVGTAAWLEACKAEAQSTEEKLDNMSEMDVVLLWVNFQLGEYQVKVTKQLEEGVIKKRDVRINLKRRVDNFTTCFQDGEVLCALLSTIAPPEVDRAGLLNMLSAADHEKRAENLLKCLHELDPMLRDLRLLNREDLALSLNPDLLGVTCALLLQNHFHIPLCTPHEWFDNTTNIVEDIEERKSHSEEQDASSSSTAAAAAAEASVGESSLGEDDMALHEQVEVTVEEEMSTREPTPMMFPPDASPLSLNAADTHAAVAALYAEDKNKLSNTPLGALLKEAREFQMQMKDSNESMSSSFNGEEFQARVASIVAGLPNVLEVAYLRNRLWNRLRHRMRCFVVHAMSARARNEPLQLKDHREVARKTKETSFLDKDGKVRPEFTDLSNWDEVNLIVNPRSRRSSVTEEHTAEDIAAARITNEFGQAPIQGLAISVEDVPVVVEEIKNKRGRRKSLASRSQEITPEEEAKKLASLAHELELCQEIVLFYYDDLRSIFDRYAQADQSEAKVASVNNKAQTMNVHEMWIFIREIGLARNKKLAARVESIFATVLSHKTADRFNEDIDEPPSFIRSVSDVHRNEVSKQADEFSFDPDTLTDIDFCQFVEFLLRLAFIRGITSSETRTLAKSWKNMEAHLLHSRAQSVGETFMMLQERKSALRLKLDSEPKMKLRGNHNQQGGGGNNDGNQNGLTLRLFVLLNTHVIPKAARLNVGMFRDQFIDANVGKVFRTRRKDLLKIFHLYSVSKTVSVTSTGKKEELWANTMDYGEFIKLLKDSKLLGEKQLTQMDVYSIFTNVQSDAQAPKNPSAKTVDTKDAKKRKIKETDLNDASGEDLIYSEFLEALAAIATFRQPNPYVGMSTRLSTFLDQTLLPWARKNLFRKMTKADKKLLGGIK